MYVEQTFQQV